jgi:hypothetical protein
MPRESLTAKHRSPGAEIEALARLQAVSELTLNEAELSSEQKIELAVAVAQAIGKLSAL